MVKHFVNLSNGLEALANFSEEGRQNLNFCYIASTTLERKDYLKLLQDLDHNLLFNLAIGNKCYFYDYGTNRPFSKTCYFGVPFIVYCLTRLWLGLNEPLLAYRTCRRGLQKFHEYERFNYLYGRLFLYDRNKDKDALRTKLLKYKNKFLFAKKIDLIAVSESTKMDGNFIFYRSEIEKYLL